MKRAIILLVLGTLGLCLSACKHNEPTPITPSDTTTAIPIWKLHPDLIFSNKILIAAHANAKRLVIAGINGFFQMDAGDSSFVKPSQFGSTIYRYGVGGQAAFVGESTATPVISDHLYGSIRADGGMVGLSVIGDSLSITGNYSQAASSLYFNDLLPNQGFTGLYTGLNTLTTPFGSINESTQTLLVHSAYTGNSTCLVTRKDNAKYFASYTSNVGYPQQMIKSYQPNLLANLKTLASIAVDDHFVATTYTPYQGITIINTDGTLKRISNPPLLPSTYFYYRGHLYGGDNQGNLIRSLNGGLSWQTMARYSFSTIPHYAEINGQLIAYGHSQLFWLDDGTETFTIHNSGSTSLKELNNNGLQDNELTGLVQFGSQIYGTTLSGLFHLKLSDFFVVKPL